MPEAEQVVPRRQLAVVPGGGVEPPAPSEQDLLEASTVTAQSSGHQFEIQLGHMCNNRCVFCVSGHLSKNRMVRPLEAQPILDVIGRAREEGAVRIIFLGGEPTIQPAFMPALEHASQLGFEEIVIFTNGVRLAQPGFLDACLALGRFTWRISIQGANEAAHVAVTKKPDSFRRIVQGIELLRARGQRVTVNMCVCEESYRSLPDYPELVRKYGIEQVHVDVVRPTSSGVQTEAYLRAIMPRYSDMAPHYAAMLRGFEEWNPDFDINVGNLPYCVLPEWGHRIHHGGENTVTQSSSQDGLEDKAVNKYEVHKRLRRHTERCQQCCFVDRCSGVFHEYLEIYGDQEFQPVSLERLRQLDPKQNNFSVLVAPLVRSLMDAPPPEGWALSSHFLDARSRRVEIRYERAGGGAAALQLLPAVADTRAGQRAPLTVFSSDQFRASLSVEGWYPSHELEALVGWAQGVLSADPRVRAASAVDLVAVHAARGEDPALGRSRTRMLGLVRALQHTARFAGWRYAGAESEPSGNAVVVRVGGPEGLGVAVRIAAVTTDGRSGVDATFSLSAGTDPATARPAVEAIVAALKRREQPRRAR